MFVCLKKYVNFLKFYFLVVALVMCNWDACYRDFGEVKTAGIYSGTSQLRPPMGLVEMVLISRWS